MITRNFEITIRIPEQNYIPTLFQVVENDNDVYNLTIHITDGINEIDYSQVSSATITFALANGAVVQSDPERLAISSGGITYEMGTTEISCPGKVLASIQLFGSGGERLTTARFRFEVVADLITPDAVQSESHFPLLQQLVADVEQLKQDIVDLQIPDGSIMDVKLSDAAGQIKQRFASHKAENVTKVIIVGRDISIAGVQTVTVGFKIKSLSVLAIVNGTKKMSNGVWAENLTQYCIGVAATSGLNYPSHGAVLLLDDISNKAVGKIQNITDTTFEINWEITGTPTGTAGLYMLASTH